MGHKKKDGKAGRTLHQQAYDKLQKMQRLVTASVLISSKIRRILQEKFTAFRPTRRTLST